jgi:DNA-binding NarL/FixJ family response regulator
MINGYDIDPATEGRVANWSNHQILYQEDVADGTRVDPDIGMGVQPANPTSADLHSLTIGLVDFYRLTQECLTRAFDSIRSDISILNFPTVRDCVAEPRSDMDLIICYLHGSEISDATIMQTIGPICLAFPTTPIIVFSDADYTHQTKIMRAVLKCGGRGLVPTQTASLAITLAAIRLVKAGGTFVPVDLLLSTRPDRTPSRQNRLTSRQLAVLGHLQQGKANKIIAYELGMSESTVKVHVRNIMRKMGATNRTQAAYKAQNFSDDFDGTR